MGAATGAVVVDLGAVPAERGVNALQLNSLADIGRNLLYSRKVRPIR